MNRLTLSVLVMGMALAAAPQAVDKAEVAYKAALEKEVADGDLKSAIAQYERLVRSGNRAVAARALLRMGQCYEKLGSAEARKAYERALKEFADQADSAAQARSRLAALRTSTPAATETRARVLWDNSTNPWGTVSADGRYLSLQDWTTHDVIVKDLVSGEIRHLTHRTQEERSAGETEGTVISPDGKRVAYTWYSYSKQESSPAELRIVGADGKGDRLLHKSGEYSNLQPVSWSPDGMWILAEVSRRGAYEIILVSPDTGVARLLFRCNGWFPRNVTLSPDAKWVAFTRLKGHTSLPASYTLCLLPMDGSETEPREIVASAKNLGWSPDGRSLIALKYRDRAFDVHVAPVSNGRATGEARQVHTLPPFFNTPLGVTSSGSLIFATSRDTADVQVAPVDIEKATIGSPSAATPVIGVDGTATFSFGARISPDGRKLFRVQDLKTVQVESLTDGGEHTVIIQLPFVSRVEWAADSESLLASGGNASGESGIFRLDAKSGAAALLAATINHRAWAITDDGSTLYYLKGPALLARDLRTGQDRTVIQALPKKPSGHAIDARVSHDGRKLAIIQRDRLWIIDTQTGQHTEKVAFGGMEASRFTGVGWSADDRRILVMENNWQKRLNDVVSYPLDGGEAVRTHLGGVNAFWLSRDAKQVVLMRSRWHQQVWALENFLPAGR